MANYIDNHFHGGGGISNDQVADIFIQDKSAGLKALDKLLEPHKKSGTAKHVLSLVTADNKVLINRIKALSEIVKLRDDILGIHLEANFISPLHKGAHEEKYLSNPDLSIIKDFIDASEGQIVQITVAPELSGGIKAVEYIRSENIVASIGHTDANYEMTKRALEAGATNFTHLFNAMGDIGHRSPGPVMAARDWYKAGKYLTVEIINDGVHIEGSIIKLVFDLFSDFQTKQTTVVLITDAMEATGQKDGNYKIGNLPVIVEKGIAKIAGTNTIAGSTLTLGQAKDNTLALGVDKDVVKNSLAKKILIG
jgi:N-acetylglucosamine-6-phosphate deacetylase